jgi:hypothetical protein
MGDYFSRDEECYYPDYDDDDRDPSDELQDLETEVSLPCAKGPSSEVNYNCTFDFRVTVFTP